VTRRARQQARLTSRVVALDHADHTAEDTDVETRNVLLAAGVGDQEDDPNLPCLTIRMWCIGIGFCLLGSAVNTLYTFRVPSLSISQSAIQFLAFPIGRLWQYTVPDWGVTVFGSRISLNPGPFNYKVRRPARSRISSDR
jgi:hypothetical protein